MAEKMDEPIFHVTGWVNGWIAIAVARSYYPGLYGDRFPSTLQTLYPD